MCFGGFWAITFINDLLFSIAVNGHSGSGTPVLIPNTEVKRADVSCCTVFDTGTMIRCLHFYSFQFVMFSRKDINRALSIMSR